MLSVFRRSRIDHLVEMHQQLAGELSALRSLVLPRLQRVENELIVAELGRFLAELHAAARLAAHKGSEAASALESGLRASITPLPRGKAGGLARDKQAWRYLDGTFMPESEKWEAYHEEYERYAAGGRARAAAARRATDGTFLGGTK